MKQWFKTQIQRPSVQAGLVIATLAVAMVGSIVIAQEPVRHYTCASDFTENGDHVSIVQECDLVVAGVTPTPTRRTPTATRTATGIPATNTPVPPTATATAIPPSATPTDTPIPPTVPVPTDAPTVTPTSVSSTGKPIGPFHYLDASHTVYPGFTTSMMSLNSVDAEARLLEVQALGMHVFVSLQGGRSGFQNPDGSFNLELWKTKEDRFRSVNLQQFIDDGTIIGNMLGDEWHDGSNWNGQPVPYADIEAAAAYSKSIWPNMPTGGGTNPVFLAGAPFQWVALDFALTPYGTNRGDVNTFLNSQTVAAQAEGLTLYFSINVINGGTGGANVSAEQLSSWGTLFLNHPTICGLTFWTWNQDDGAYFRGASISPIIEDLIDLANSKPACQ